MDNLLLNKLENNLKNTHNDTLDNIVIKEYIQNINNSMKELNELLEDVKDNNIINLQNKYKERQIEKKTMEPFIKYF